MMFQGHGGVPEHHGGPQQHIRGHQRGGQPAVHSLQPHLLPVVAARRKYLSILYFIKAKHCNSALLDTGLLQEWRIICTLGKRVGDILSQTLTVWRIRSLQIIDRLGNRTQAQEVGI